MTACGWCAHPFEEAVIGGRQKAYCNAKCRALRHKALRQYAGAMMQAGLLTPELLRTWYEANVYDGGDSD